MNERFDMTPVALYARVSSDRQDVDLSVSAQLRALRDYAEKHSYLVAREYVDEAESGRIADRPQFQKMLDEASKPEAPFKEILVWKFSRFTRKREHAVAFKAMLRRRGVRVVSITEQADDTPTGKLLEAIIESVDEFYSENLAQEVTRGMRESASRGFWVTTYAPYGYRKVYVQDGPKKRPKLELDPPLRRRGPPHLRHGAPGQQHPRRDQGAQRRGRGQPQGKAVAQDHRPQRAAQRSLHGHVGLGDHGQGRRAARARRGRSPRHRLQATVPKGQETAGISRSEEGPPPAFRQPLPAQRSYSGARPAARP